MASLPKLSILRQNPVNKTQYVALLITIMLMLPAYSSMPASGPNNQTHSFSFSTVSGMGSLSKSRNGVTPRHVRVLYC